MIYQADLNAVLALLKNCLSQQTTNEGLLWLGNIQKLSSLEVPDQLAIITFNTIPRFFDEKNLQLDPDEIHLAHSLRKNWRFENWSLVQTARAVFILTLAHHQFELFQKIFRKLFSIANVQELISLYKIFPLLPYPQQICYQAIEGVRSNMASIFNAIALSNSYPADYFEQNAWNQLVLKAFFIDSPIDEIIGIEIRSNPTLAHMLIDYAQERLAAHRSIKTELWRIVGMCADETILKILKCFLRSSNPDLQQGAAIASYQNSKLLVNT